MSSEHGFFDAAIERLHQATERIGRSGGVLLGLSIVAAIALADAWMGPSVRLTAIYVLGVGATAWCSKRRDAVFVALVAALISTAVHLQSGSLEPRFVPLVLTLFFRFAGIGSVAVLVSWARTTNDKLHDLSMRDELTGLLNRRALVERLEIEIARARRSDAPMALVYADVDLFKDVNDRFGHVTGDEFLMRIAEAIELTIRPTDIAARMGGDEFVIILPETDDEGAQALTERVAGQLADLEADYGTRLSFGVAVFPGAPESVEAALRTADREMYAVKRARHASPAEPEEVIVAAPAPTQVQSTT